MKSVSSTCFASFIDKLIQITKSFVVWYLRSSNQNNLTNRCIFCNLFSNEHFTLAIHQLRCFQNASVFNFGSSFLVCTHIFNRHQFATNVSTSHVVCSYNAIFVSHKFLPPYSFAEKPNSSKRPP